MTTIDQAKAFADLHLDKAFDAVLVDATPLPNGSLVGNVFIDTTGSHGDGAITFTPRASSVDGIVYTTEDRRYLVQFENGRPGPSSRIEYVAGLMFSLDREYVALIQKQKPAWQRGRLNAIGGKVEPGETHIAAQVREFEEETGVATTEADWNHVSCLVGTDFVVHFYAAFSDDVWNVQTQEAEETFVGPVAGFIINPRLMENLRVIIPLALDCSGIVKPVEFRDVVPNARAA